MTCQKQNVHLPVSHSPVWVLAIVTALAVSTRLVAQPPKPVRIELQSSREATMGLEQGWADPPRMARTRVWWWWLNGNVTKAAITRDLEEMKAKGIGGANVIDAGGANQRGNRQVPHGPDFASPEWRKLFVHALAEADRLELELGFNIQSGWNLGGPTVAPEDSAKRISSAQFEVRGGKSVSVSLPVPTTRDGFYRDVAVVAFPLPARNEQSVAYHVSAGSGSSQDNFPAERAIDGDQETFWVSRGFQSGQGPTPQRPQWLELRFERPVEADRMIVVPRPGYGPKQCRLEVAVGQGEFETLAEFSMTVREAKTVTFPKTTGDRFRLVLLDAFDPRFPERPRNVQVVELALMAGEKLLTPPQQAAGRIQDFAQKAYFRYPGSFTATQAWHLLKAAPAQPGDPTCRLEDVIVLTGQLDDKGTLNWDAPPGRWKVLRFGYTLSGSHVSTHSENGGGLAIDYLDRNAFEQYWQSIMEPILEEAKPYVGRSLRFLHTDSWELGPVNWTADMPRQFRRLRGYDMTRWLPVLAGHVVESREVSTRFLNDFRRTLADLIAECKYGTFSEYAHRCNLGIHPESGGPHAAPIDALKCLGRNDVPMGEFWARSKTHRVEDWQRLFVKQSASAAHVYGKRLMLAEAFTTIGPQWERDPRDLKPVFDRAACEGLNVTMLHTFDCSPPEMGMPGQAYFAGTHINPNVTWWDQAGAFFEYMNRCHFLLQQGLFVADVLYFYGENIPAFVRLKRDDPAGVLPGYDYDVINAEALLSRAAVDKGRIVLPDGMSYRLLVLPDHDAIRLETIEHLADLVEAGMTLVGRRPQKPLGLAEYPDGDTRFRKLTQSLWGECDGDEITENRYGKGRVVWGKTARQVLEEDHIGLDFTYTREKGSGPFCAKHPAGRSGKRVLTPFPDDDTFLDFIHRATDEADIYFVANRLDRWDSADCSFRITDRQPELWDPLTGQIRDLNQCRRDDRRTVVPMRFAPNQSFFVVFRRETSVEGQASREKKDFPELQTISEITGPWQVSFDPKWGGPTSATFDQLQDWSTHPDDGIRYYSGTATYRIVFNIQHPESSIQEPASSTPPRLFLDLGDVRNLAEVHLNGHNLGTVWTEPFRVDITDAVRPTDNQLEIKVVNLWPNRLIGDQHLPPDQQRTSTNITKFTKDSPLLPSGLLGPVTLTAAKAVLGGEGINDPDASGHALEKRR